MVSIPMTVLGGLQCLIRHSFDFSFSCFNTDDGIRRAAMASSKSRSICPESFNTDDGIRRAAI